jgi:hypothetical protein
VFQTQVTAQLYIPPEPYKLWDQWLYHDGKNYHLFFLQSDNDGVWNTIGHARTPDLLHWEPLPAIPSKGGLGEWDEEPTLTGMVARQDGRYFMFYGSGMSSGRQKIGLMTSTDLMDWEKHPGNPILEKKPPYYSGTQWRDMCIRYDEDDALWHGFVCAETGTDGPRIPHARNKTLVAWVHLDDARQDNGSVLTLNYGPRPSGPCDGIGLSEDGLTWVAISDQKREATRIPPDAPMKKVPAKKPLQVAAVHEGDRVTLYRDGEVHARYQQSDPTDLVSGTAVTMGIRSLGYLQNRTGFFAGRIEEAHLYGVALTAKALQDLESGRADRKTALDQRQIQGINSNIQGRASRAKPIGRWTFEDGTTKDSAGTFPPGALHGGARVAAGKLHLDGVDDYLHIPASPKTCVAHLTTKNFVDWKYLPPIFISPDFFDVDDPDYFELGGRHYLVFSSQFTRKRTPNRKLVTGVFYVIGDRREGPYRPPENPVLLGYSVTQDRFYHYVGRTMPYEDSRLLYHHTCGYQCAAKFATPKLVRKNADGTLWLKYWSGLDPLQKEVIVDADDTGKIATGEGQGRGTWKLDAQSIHGESSTDGPCILRLPIADAADVMLTCTLDRETSKAAGVVWRWAGGKGGCIRLHRSGAVLSVDRMARKESALHFDSLDEYHGLDLSAPPIRLRLLVRADRVEVYVNDRWISNCPTYDIPAAGGIGLWVDSGSARFQNVRVAKLEPLERAGEKRYIWQRRVWKAGFCP